MKENKESFQDWLDKLSKEVRKANKPDDVVYYKGVKMTRQEFLDMIKNESSLIFIPKPGL